MSTLKHAPEKFTRLRAGHGATKLSECAVAPLVAAARGYETILPDEVKEAALRLKLGQMTQGPARELRRVTGASDSMLMHWFKIDDVFRDAKAGDEPTHTSLQLRPAEPVPSKTDGKYRKYHNLSGMDTVLDIHPATPASWFDDASRLVFTEGLIKGDAALSALLRESGMDASALADDTCDNSRQVLREAMEQVPVADRALVISFVGVHNWKNRQEWASLRLKGREALIVFDADLRDNAGVWDPAFQLVSYLEGRGNRCSSVQIVDLAAAASAASSPKAGLDDLIAEGSLTFAGFTDHLIDLPERPLGGVKGKEGDWDVSESGTSVYEVVRQPNPGGGDGDLVQAERVPIGGRVLTLEAHREPTKEELRTGQVSESASREASSGPLRVEIELKWVDPTTEHTRTAVVSGPAVILATQPKDWPRLGAHIPGGVLTHPEWPPAKGENWLRAIKRNNAAPPTHTARWLVMGWVPTQEGLPVYVIGDQVITIEGVKYDPSLIGVTSTELAAASSFGVIPTPEGVDWKEQARQDLEDVLDAYIDSGAWTEPGVAATALAAGLRPALPMRNRTTLYAVGARRSGKTWTASHIMSFWQPEPGTWSGDHLPGSARDTIASTEIHVAHTPIWVADDLAPSVDRNRANDDEAKMGELIRSIHNGAGKGRARPDMTTRPIKNPRALLVVTAENEPSVSSVSDRAIMLHFRSGFSLHDDRSVTNRLETMREDRLKGGQPARLAQAFIRWHLVHAQELGGWEVLQEELAETYQSIIGPAAAKIVEKNQADIGAATRHATQAADLIVALVQLEKFAKFLGMDRKTWMRLRFTASGLPTLVAQQVAQNYHSQKSTTPARQFLQAVNSLLSQGLAHIDSLESPGSPPISEGNDKDHVNTRLGWTKQGSDWRPSGARIGYLVRGQDHKRQVVLLNPGPAFTEAKRRREDLIPHGQKQAVTMSSVWDEDLAVPEEDGWRRQTNGRSLTSSVRVSVGDNAERGIPVYLDTLHNIEDDEQDSTEVG